MNYSDFEKIEQDEWSLTRPTFPTPKGGTLTVVGWSGKKYTSKTCVVECSRCKKDKELHGDGLYLSPRVSLRNGNIPCGCSNRPNWTQTQYLTRIERIAKEKSLKFLGFFGDFSGTESKLRLSCERHGEWTSTKMGHFINQGVGCPGCSDDNKSGVLRQNDSEHILSFVKTGRFQKGTLFWRSSSRKSTSGSSLYWKVKCPVCSRDEYVRAGLCNGIFESTITALKRGFRPCRCSKSYHYTGPQWEYRVIKRCREMGYTFEGWLTEASRTGIFRYSCPMHGRQETTSTGIISGGGCPGCAGKNQRQCYINQVFDNDWVVALKFGIAKDSSNRRKRQNSRNLFRMEQVGIWGFPSVKACKAAEKQCKRELECGILTKRELKDGHTETTHIKNLDRIIEIYENHGGKRINTNEER